MAAVARQPARVLPVLRGLPRHDRRTRQGGPAAPPGSASTGAKITYGGLVLGVFALILLYLSLTGIWLWFPRPSKWRRSMDVRWKRGRFARDTDLHKVAG